MYTHYCVQYYLTSCTQLVTESNSQHADRAAGLLVNLTRDSDCCKVFLTELGKDTTAFHALVVAATSTSHNTANNNLHLAMGVLRNISQLEEGRK